MVAQMHRGMSSVSSAPSEPVSKGTEPRSRQRSQKIPGLVIYEVPIQYHGRTYEQSKKIAWKDGISAFWWIVKYNLQSGRRSCLRRPVEELKTLIRSQAKASGETSLSRSGNALTHRTVCRLTPRCARHAVLQTGHDGNDDGGAETLRFGECAVSVGQAPSVDDGRHWRAVPARLNLESVLGHALALCDCVRPRDNGGELFRRAMDRGRNRLCRWKGGRLENRSAAAVLNAARCLSQSLRPHVAGPSSD